MDDDRSRRRLPAFSPYEGAPDLNAAAALQLDGVLFMEGEGEPGEIRHLKRDLRTFADDAAGAGEWLATAMQSSWDVAVVLLDIDELADMLGERHRIIANNWQGGIDDEPRGADPRARSRPARPRRLHPAAAARSISPTGTPPHAASTRPPR